jgi:hypothetical protein
MNIPDDILLFSGFSLAHSAYSICDVGPGELLIPLFISEHRGKRDVRRFEASTQTEAVTEAKRFVAEVDGTLDLWTLCREGCMEGSDVLSVEASSAGFRRRVITIQPFRSAWLDGGFALLGDPRVVVDGEDVDASTLSRYREIIEEGLSMHPAADVVLKFRNSSKK